MNVKVCYSKRADTPILLFVPSSTYPWKWNKSIDGVSPQELNLEAHVPMASLKRGLEGVNFIICSSFKFQEANEGHIGCVKKKEVSVVQTTHLFYN